MVSVREKMSTLYKLTLFYEFLQPLFLIITVQMLQNFNHLLISFYYAVNVFCCFCYFHFLMKKKQKCIILCISSITEKSIHIYKKNISLVKNAQQQHFLRVRVLRKNNLDQTLSYFLVCRGHN